MGGRKGFGVNINKTITVWLEHELFLKDNADFRLSTEVRRLIDMEIKKRAWQSPIKERVK